MLQERWFGHAAISYAAVEDSAPRQAVIRLVERLSGKQRIVRAYMDARRSLQPGDDIFATAMRSLDLKLVFSAQRLAAAPPDGPLVVVANHPFGVIDGLVLCHLIGMLRNDFKVVAMSTLCRVPEIRDHVLPINFADTREAVLTSARSRRLARTHLEAGGCLIVFPAGQVSTARRLFGPAEDAEWHPFVARLVMTTRATVLPVFFEGQNSLMFQLASRISPTLRLSLLMQEAAKRIGTEVEARIGAPLDHDQLQTFGDPKELIEHLRTVTHRCGAISGAGDPGDASLLAAR